MSTILVSKAALELLTSRFEYQGVQPACLKVEAHTGKQSYACSRTAGVIRIVPNDPKTII